MYRNNFLQMYERDSIKINFKLPPILATFLRYIWVDIIGMKLFSGSLSFRRFPVAVKQMFELKFCPKDLLAQLRLCNNHYITFAMQK